MKKFKKILKTILKVLFKAHDAGLISEKHKISTKK